MFPAIYLASAAVYYLLSRRVNDGQSVVQKLADRGRARGEPEPAVELTPVRIEGSDA